MSKNNFMNTYGRFDVVFEKGNGCRLYDVNGNEYIDFISGVAVNCLGHSNPAIVKTISEQSATLMHISNYFWSTKLLELAEKLCSYSDHQQLFFCNSGTEAVEVGLKLARKYGRLKGGENKNEIIYMNNSFHGRTMGALSVTGQGKYQDNFRPLIGNVKEVKFNDIESIKSVISENTCGVIIEPIQGEGGINPVDKKYIKELRALCDKYDVLLIFDEVQCGMGRTGKLFAYQQFDVIPDVICMAKGIAGGFPMGAALATEKAGSAFVPGDHGNTFGGNPLACSVSLTVLHEIMEGGVLENVNEKSKYFINSLNKLKEKHSVIKEVKGMGLLLGISVSINPKDIIDKCFENKLLLTRAGSDVIRLLPPLNVEEEYIDKAVEIIDKVITEIEAGL
ncbi:MAG: aspartate aminotransferase family protein [Bacillota bacterium]|nr:aspartate aminotransferase family protein [Bacillota bacterium]